MLACDHTGEAGRPCCRGSLLGSKKSVQNTWGNIRDSCSLECISHTFVFRMVPLVILRGFHSLLILRTEPIFYCMSLLKTLLGDRKTILLSAFHLGTVLGGTHCLFSRRLTKYSPLTHLWFPRVLFSGRTTSLPCLFVHFPML